MIKPAVILLAGVMAGCASNPYHNARNFAVGAVAADVVSTQRAFDRGCNEGNPLYGNDPSIEQIAIINLALIGLVWWMADTLEEKNGPTWPLWTLAVLRAGVVVHNERINC